jgi:hypothetical protein
MRSYQGYPSAANDCLAVMEFCNNSGVEGSIVWKGIHISRHKQYQRKDEVHKPPLFSSNLISVNAAADKHLHASCGEREQ